MGPRSCNEGAAGRPGSNPTAACPSPWDSVSPSSNGPTSQTCCEDREKSEWGAPSQLSQWSVPLLISGLWVQAPRWVESVLKTIFVKKKQEIRVLPTGTSAGHGHSIASRCKSPSSPLARLAGLECPTRVQALGPPLPPGEGRPVFGHSGSEVRRRTAGSLCGGCSGCRGAAPRGLGPLLPHPRAQYSLGPTSPQRLRAFSPPPPRRPASHPTASMWLGWGAFTPLPVGP